MSLTSLLESITNRQESRKRSKFKINHTIFDLENLLEAAIVVELPGSFRRS